MLVPSRATMRVKTQRDANASTSRVVGFQTCASSFLFSVGEEEESTFAICECSDTVASGGGSKSTAMPTMKRFARIPMSEA